MHLLVFTTIISLATALCAPVLPPAAEALNYVLRTGGLNFVIPLPGDCYVFASNGIRLDYNREAVKLYQTSIIHWMNIIRGNITEPDYWQFACAGRRYDGSDALLIVIRKIPGWKPGPATCSWKTYY